MKDLDVKELQVVTGGAAAPGNPGAPVPCGPIDTGPFGPGPYDPIGPGQPGQQ